MTQVSRPEDIWVLQPTKDHLITGAQYAAVTLPWTFNRMMANTASRGQQGRALNIAKGVVGQALLRHELTNRGKQAQMQRKSYRVDDRFDCQVAIEGTLRTLDVKSFNYYSDYAGVDRQPISRELIVENAAYPGPDWRRFFPMLLAHSQIAQDKEVYCFAMASSIDVRRDIDTDRIAYALTAFPYGEPLPFLAAKRLCVAREEAGKGLYIECSYISDALLNARGVTVTVLGEWDGSFHKAEVALEQNATVRDIGPFSCVSSFRISRKDHDQLYGRIEVSVCRNDFVEPLLNSARRNVNVEPAEALVLERDDFCNLVLPSQYTVYFLGWITKEDFLQACRSYTGWVWPNDKVDKYKNQPWSQITERDRKAVARAGFGDCIQKKPPLLDAGWMKTTGKGGGACCYVYPNIGRGGGVRETNLYVLPQDLHAMDELVRA